MHGCHVAWHGFPAHDCFAWQQPAVQAGLAGLHAATIMCVVVIGGVSLVFSRGSKFGTMVFAMGVLSRVGCSG